MISSPEKRLRDALKRIAEVTRDRPPTGLSHDDADGVEGTIACDDAIGFDPLPLLRSFDDHNVPVVVMGQVAGIFHGSTELTGDLDLLWSGEAAQAELMAAAFDGVSAALWDDDGNALACSVDAFCLPKVEFRTAASAGDCCTPALPWGGTDAEMDIAAFIERADSATVEGVRVHYVTRPDLITMRLAVGRPKDLRRAAELQALGL